MNKQINVNQANINSHKKTIAGLKVRLASISGADRMVELKNQLSDTQRIKAQLQLDVATMERNIRHQ